MARTRHVKSRRGPQGPPPCPASVHPGCDAVGDAGGGGDARYYTDDAGRQHFNFTQQVWLDESVQMAYTRSPSLALETLAVNLLTMVLAERDHQAAVGVTSRRALSLADAFCEECLLSAPEDAWELPQQALRDWIVSRLRHRRR